jgi:hypothetical protein
MTYVVRDFTAITPDTIELNDEEIAYASQIANLAFPEAHQWNLYLQALALQGLEHWWLERTNDLNFNKSSCSIIYPGVANLLSGICNLKIGQFIICSIAIGCLTDSRIQIPRAAIELGEFLPHFYVYLEIEEEYNRVKIQGYLSSLELFTTEKFNMLVLENNWTYSFPLEYFNTNTDSLLLLLQCWENVSLPEIISPPLMPNLKNKLNVLLSEIKNSERELWEILNWEEAATLLRDPELLNWFDEQRRQENLVTENLDSTHTSSINVALWLEDKLDNLAKELGWVLLPPFTSAWRAISPEIEVAISQLKLQGMKIPDRARGAYLDLVLSGVGLRLYAIAWTLISNVPEWSLLIVLGLQINLPLTSKISLLIRDELQLLGEESLIDNNGNAYIYVRVAGNWNERFWASIIFDRDSPDASIALPSFIFSPQSLTL